ncbi:hypothetical protein A0J61_11127 [Choanephora cucurbitarum]|uniref:Uncharacterized protein n=1 Tax=Choanephora cucurbitarum TaxID=101091 RepID=A0A1C7MVG2_9FUNG|nr:hypothetical protein A0J61_11127 [Choanephora cucurbitarum]
MNVFRSLFSFRPNSLLMMPRFPGQILSNLATAFAIFMCVYQTFSHNSVLLQLQIHSQHCCLVDG